MMDFLDNFLNGPMNIICHAQILFNMLRYRRFRLSLVTTDRLDKNQAAILTVFEVAKKLRANGVRVFGYRFDAKHLYIYVAKSQEGQAKWLLCNTMHSNNVRDFGRRWSK